ncbi:MAG: RagB/SusD family nutrient uptake outer membrane protein [Bacteroidales bacterium]|jgi:hypothetical protein
MKKFSQTTKIVALAVFVLAASSCNDYLETNSSTDVSDNIVLSTTTGLNMVLTSSYRVLHYGANKAGAQEVGAYVGIAGYHLYYDCSGADIISHDNYGGSPEECYKLNPRRTQSSEWADKIWINSYKLINEVNIILDALPDAAGPDDEKNYIKGQALFMRAVSYFHLVMNYQQTYALAKNKRGVILRKSSSDPVEMGFSTVQECYDLIVADLKEAKTLLADFERAEKWQINADVVSGILARVYQVMGNWDGALAEASAVYQKHSALMTKDEWYSGFDNDIINVNEVIWAVVNTNVSNNGENTIFCYWYNQDPSYGEGQTDGPIYNFRNLFVDQRYVDLFDATDYRGFKCAKTAGVNDADITDGNKKAVVMFWHRTANGEPEVSVNWAYNKFKYYGDADGAPQGHQYADYPLMRSSEMLLVKAEAEANLDRTNEALASLNTLQRARQAKLTTTTAKTDLLEEIYKERRKELLCEGVTGMYDLVRLQKPLVRYGRSATNPAGHYSYGLSNLDGYNGSDAQPMGTLPSNDYRWFCQIPFNEFSYNTAISELTDQNPFKGTGE